MELVDRILRKLREWMDRIAEAIGEQMAPEPEPIPIPVNDRVRRRR